MNNWAFSHMTSGDSFSRSRESVRQSPTTPRPWSQKQCTSRGCPEDMQAIQEPVFRYRLWRRARALTPPGYEDRVSSAHSQEEDRPQAHALQYFTLRRSPPSRARVTSTGGALASGRGTLDGAYYSHAERKSQYGLGNALSNSARRSHLTGTCTMVPRRN